MLVFDCLLTVHVDTTHQAPPRAAAAALRALHNTRRRFNASLTMTSLSETIRQPPLAEPQTALGKQKYVMWNAGICPIVEIL